MSPTAPSTDNPATRPTAPPEDAFWQRYSPHGELPLSGAGSLAIHMLLIGFMLLSAWLAYAVFNRASRTLPVEAVRLDLGGGGGNPNGVGDGKNTGTMPQEVGDTRPDENPTPVDNDNTEKRPDLKVETTPRAQNQFSPDAVRQIQQFDTDAAKKFTRLADVTSRLRLPDGPQSGRGQGGTGSGGGSGSGTGTGTGSGEGAGRGNLTQREKRMLRWTMMFNTSSGRDYVSQLRGLGAILAIPVGVDANGKEKFKFVRNLGARPAQLEDGDIEKINRIYWIDDNPQSIADVMSVLGLKVHPRRFVAFMPAELEAKLYQLEKEELQRKYGNRSEDDIEETKFSVVGRGDTFEPRLLNLKVKR